MSFAPIALHRSNLVPMQSFKNAIKIPPHCCTTIQRAKVRGVIYSSHSGIFSLTHVHTYGYPHIAPTHTHTIQVHEIAFTAKAKEGQLNHHGVPTGKGKRLHRTIRRRCHSEGANRRWFSIVKYLTVCVCVCVFDAHSTYPTLVGRSTVGKGEFCVRKGTSTGCHAEGLPLGTRKCSRTHTKLSEA